MSTAKKASYALSQPTTDKFEAMLAKLASSPSKQSEKKTDENVTTVRTNVSCKMTILIRYWYFLAWRRRLARSRNYLKNCSTIHCPFGFPRTYIVSRFDGWSKFTINMKFGISSEQTSDKFVACCWRKNDHSYWILAFNRSESSRTSSEN